MGTLSMRRIPWWRFTMSCLGITLAAFCVSAPTTAQSTREKQAPRAMVAPPSFAPIVRRVSPAVVSVAARATKEMLAGSGQEDDSKEPLFGHSSGFIIHPSGLIITSDHGTDDSGQIAVTLAGGQTYQATVVGRDASTDLALLKIDAGRPLPTVRWGDSRALSPGDWVITIGNPHQLANSVTAGIISAVGRADTANPLIDLIQVNVPLNHGNSGGPVFNLNGEVVGINRSISPKSSGIGFVISSATARGVVEKLSRNERIVRGWIGLYATSSDETFYDVASRTRISGAQVVSVTSDSPAARAGIKEGDVIIRVRGQPIRRLVDLSREVARAPVGTVANISIVRDGTHMALQVLVDESK